MEYDPLLAKLAAWAPDRGTVIRRMLRALEEYAIVGVETNLAFFREILHDAEFREGRLNTGFVAGFFKRRPPAPEIPPEMELVAALAAAAQSGNEQPETRNEKRETSLWLSEGRSGMLR